MHPWYPRGSRRPISTHLFLAAGRLWGRAGGDISLVNYGNKLNFLFLTVGSPLCSKCPPRALWPGNRPAAPLRWRTVGSEFDTRRYKVRRRSNRRRALKNRQLGYLCRLYRSALGGNRPSRLAFECSFIFPAYCASGVIFPDGALISPRGSLGATIITHDATMDTVRRLYPSGANLSRSARNFVLRAPIR